MYLKAKRTKDRIQIYEILGGSFEIEYTFETPPHKTRAVLTFQYKDGDHKTVTMHEHIPHIDFSPAQYTLYSDKGCIITTI
jgi:hypothetical protein